MMDDIDSRETRSIILEQARELFLALGYHNTTMRAIATAAGISTGPLYFHFRNKAEVYFHICSDALDYLIADFRRAAGEDSHAALRLKNIYNVYKSFYYREPQLFEIMHLATNIMGGIDLSPPLEDTLNVKSQELVLIMEGVVREGIACQELRPVDPSKLALYLYSVAEGVFHSNRTGVLQRAEVGLDEMIDTAIDLIGYSLFEREGICQCKHMKNKE